MWAARFLTFALVSIAFCPWRTCAQEASPLPPARSAGAVTLPTIDVFATTPLSGIGVDVDKVPAGITAVSAEQIERARSPSLVKALAQQTPSITVSEVAGNPFQPDVEFRGFDASPVSGTPQGLAVYQNGVRINEAFGDTVNWDLIPTAAVRSIDVISNNPAFGLNALGGALSVQMKDGFNFQGTTIDVMGGSYGRLQSSLQWGKQVGDYAIYGALEAVHDNGYRDHSASEIRRFYSDVGYKDDSSELHLNIGAADNVFGATASAPVQLLDQNWSSVYTTPQASRNEVGYVNATATLNATATWTIQGAAHVRVFNQTTVDGNSTDVAPAPIPRCYASTALPPPTASTARNSPIHSRPAQLWAKSTERQREPPALARRCRRPTRIPCGGATIISSSGAVSITASPIFRPAPSLESSNLIISSPAQAFFWGRPAIPFRTAPCRSGLPISIADSMRSIRSTSRRISRYRAADA